MMRPVVTSRDERRHGGGATSDRGSSVVEFTLVAPLVLLVALAVLQVALALHVRSTLTAAAAEGARVAALADSGLAAGERRTHAVLADVLGGGTATTVEASRTTIAGAPAVRVRITGRLPLVGLLGPSVLTVEGHALTERAS